MSYRSIAGVIPLLLALCACRYIPGHPTPGAQFTGGDRTPSLFVVDRRLDKYLGHRFILFNPETKDFKVTEVDFSILGWDVTLGNSRFYMVNGPEFIHYNPFTREIVFVLFPGFGGIAGRKPEEALPDPPFRFAIYRTTFNTPGKYQPLYQSNAVDQFVYHSVLDIDLNTLILAIRSFGPGIHQEIWKFNLSTASMMVIDQTATILEDKILIETSDLRISQDGKRLVQLLVYGKTGYYTDQTLYLMDIDLQTNATSYQKADQGNGFYFEITGYSITNHRLAFYTTEKDRYQLWIKNLKKDKPAIPTFPAEIGNLGLYTAPDGAHVLVGLKSGWAIYSISENTYLPTPLDRPLVWDPTSRYIAGLIGGNYIVYDTQSKTSIDLPLAVSIGNNQVESAQWR